MQTRCKAKKVPGAATGRFPFCASRRFWSTSIILEKKSDSKAKETKLNGTVEEHDENSNASMMSVNGHEQSSIVKEEVSPKRNAERTAKVKVTKYGSENEDEDDGVIHAMETDDAESDYMGSDSDTEKKIKKVTAKPKKVTKPKSGQISPHDQAPASLPSLPRHQQHCVNTGEEESKCSSFRMQKVIQLKCLVACEETSSRQSGIVTEKSSGMSYGTHLSVLYFSPSFF